MTKTDRNVWAKPGIKLIRPASSKLQKTLPYGKMPLWCLACVTHLHIFRERGNQPISRRFGSEYPVICKNSKDHCRMERCLCGALCECDSFA